MQPKKVKLSDKFLSSKDVQQKLQISRKTLCVYNRQGKITPIRVSERKFLYDSTQIEEFLTRAKFGGR